MKYNLIGFIIFLSIFFGIYGGFHYYGYSKFKAVFKPDFIFHIALIVFLVCMIFSPIAIRILEKNGNFTAATISAHIAYGWMGALFLFVSISFGFDIYKWIARGLGAVFHFNPAHITLSPGFTLLFSTVLTLGILIYGFGEARAIRVERVTIETKKENRLKDRLRVVQITDVHLGLMGGEERLNAILKLVEAQSPDVLVSTGDFVDGHVTDKDKVTHQFRKLHMPQGKFAVVGNHEYYHGLEESIAFTEACGFTMLRGNRVELPGNVCIAGVDDAGRNVGTGDQGTSESDMLAQCTPEAFTLFLKHQPRVNKNTLGQFDLMLTGHVHSGQIFPFTLITSLAYGFKNGLTPLNGGSSLYLSRGTGTWGPPIRFLAPPEITVIDIVPRSSK